MPSVVRKDVDLTELALAGKSVLVTGAGRGIGREIALLCAAEGALVVVNDPGVATTGEGGDSAPATQVADEIAALGGRAVANFDSVASPEGANAMVEQAVREFGRIDGVVNNAGILRDRSFTRMSHEEWHAVIDVHLNGAFNVSHAAAQHFRQQGSGAFVHFTSASGLVGNLGQANYSAAKLGIVGLSKSIALDMRRYGVRSNCVCPFAWSRMIATLPTTTPEEQLRVERGKLMTPDKIAPVVAFLLSDAASDVNAQIIAVRRNEVMLMSQPRPIRSVHTSDGWTVSKLAETMLPAFQSSFYPLDVSADVFSWDPI